MRKNKWLSLLAAGALSLTAVALCSMEPLFVSASEFETEQEPTLSESQFLIQEGASVRFATDKETQEGKAVNGIRFAAYITEGYYENLTESVYPTATEIVLQSTVSKIVEAGETAPAPFTCSWNLKNAITFDEKGVASFYHTLNFSSLTGENLKAANAFDMQADFWIEVKTESNSQPIKIEADNAETVSTARSMRQVAYTAYTTVGTDEKPNPVFQDERLKNYFSLGASAETVYDMESATASILNVAPDSVNASSVYLVNEESFALVDVSDKTLAGDTGVFKAQEASVGAVKKLVYFDENNVAYPTSVRLVSKIIQSEAELADVLKWNATASNPDDKYDLGYCLLSADITVNAKLVNAQNRYFENGTFDGNGHTITLAMGENHYDGVFGRLTDVTVKNLQLKLTKDFGVATGDSDNVAKMKEAILIHSSDVNSSFKNISIYLNRASADTTPSYSEDGESYKLYLTTDDMASAHNVALHVADGVFVPKTSGATMTAYGFKVVSSWCVISSELSARDWVYKLYASLPAAVSANEQFLTLQTCGYWTFDKTNKTLTFGKTDGALEEDQDDMSNITITQTASPYVSSNDYSTAYADFASAASPTYLVPGLNEGFVPQGMDVWDEKELLFISGYFGKGNTSGSSSSMIVVVDLKTGELAGKYCLKNSDGRHHTGHVGGLAITEKNIFLSSSYSLMRIPLSQIDIVGSSGTLEIVERIYVPVKASFCNYSNGVLWVGDWASSATDEAIKWKPDISFLTSNVAWAVGYKMQDTESEFSSENWNATLEYATPDYALSITTLVQGFTFVGDKIVLSASNQSKSSLYVYSNALETRRDTRIEVNGKYVPVWVLGGEYHQKTFSAMPASEGITDYNGKLLVVFETGTKEYSTAKNPTDHVWSVTLPQ